MRHRTLDEMVSYFNQQVSEMDIDQSYKIQLLGMISAIAYGVQKPQWIPCSERLPEKEGRYLVWAAISFIPDHVDDPDMYHGTTIASYFEQFGRYHWYGNHVEEVIAWMPLPEPWRGETDG